MGGLLLKLKYGYNLSSHNYHVLISQLPLSTSLNFGFRLKYPNILETTEYNPD
jgi:hypothetical protein